MNTIHATYAPGSWVVVSGPEVWLLVELALDDARITLLREAIASSEPLAAVLDALVRDGVAAAPAFALVRPETNALRILVRGSATVVVDSTPETHRIDGNGSVTWTECRHDGPWQRIECRGGAVGGEISRPLTEGVTTAGLLAMTTPATAGTVGGEVHAPGVVAAAADEEVGNFYDQLLGNTAEQAAFIARLEAADIEPPIMDPPLPAPPAVPVAGTPVQPELHTVNQADLSRGIREATSVTPTVLARTCPAGHASPPDDVACRVCGTSIADHRPTEIPRPALGVIRLSTGRTVELDRDVILGRRPETNTADDTADPADRPNLVQLTGSREVSRMHARITLSGWQPMLRDLGSANGTFVTMPGGQRRRLRPDEDEVLKHGCEVSLADIVSFTYTVTESAVSRIG